jgi:hypothetical protein
MPTPLVGTRPMTPAERQARYKAKKARQALASVTEPGEIRAQTEAWADEASASVTLMRRDPSPTTIGPVQIDIFSMVNPTPERRAAIRKILVGRLTYDQADEIIAQVRDAQIEMD